MKYRNLVLTGVLLALGVTLARFMHLLPLPMPAYMFSPLHLPVFVCAIVCGGRYGIACGILLPFLSFFVSGKPVFYPSAIAMAVEMSVYAIVTAMIMSFKKINMGVLAKSFIAVLLAQIIGRLTGGAVTSALLGVKGEPYLFKTFVTSYFVNTIPAIIIQLAIIPPIAKIANDYRLKSS